MSLTTVTQRHDAPDALAGLLGDRGSALGNPDGGLARAFRDGGGVPLHHTFAGLRGALNDALAPLASDRAKQKLARKARPSTFFSLPG